MPSEIIVAGAGIAGLTAAITLKLAGRDVKVIERNVASGAQRRPDWDAVENWTSDEDFPNFLRRISIVPELIRYAGFSEFSVVDPYGRRLEIRSARPFFYVVKRGPIEGGLEWALQRQAQAIAIPIDFGQSCPRERADVWAVGSSGRHARFVSSGFTFRTDHPNWVCALVDPKVAPRAYAYVAIVEGEGSLAVVTTESRRDRQELLGRAVEIFRRQERFEIRDRKNSGGSGGDFIPVWQPMSAVAIGEAGGFQDFLWGFGIRNALMTGYHAARSILNHEDWEAVVARQFRPVIRASMVNRWLFEQLPGPGYAALVRYFAGHSDLSTLVSRWYRPRRIHDLLWPFVSWRYRRESAQLGWRDRNQVAAQPGHLW